MQVSFESTRRRGRRNIDTISAAVSFIAIVKGVCREIYCVDCVNIWRYRNMIDRAGLATSAIFRHVHHSCIFARVREPRVIKGCLKSTETLSSRKQMRLKKFYCLMKARGIARIIVSSLYDRPLLIFSKFLGVTSHSRRVKIHSKRW